MSVRRRLGVCAAVLAATWLVSGRAHATFSILAVDLRDGSVGGAVASCVDLATVERVYGAVPGRGAVMTQSTLFDPAHGDALSWLARGASPESIVQALTAPSYDADFALRQYAVLSTDGQSASITGSGANGFAGDVRFSVADPMDGGAARYVASVQGNFLSGDEVLSQARAGFEDPAGCDLADRLWRALAAAGSRGAGDVRCTPAGTPAQAAVMSVDPPPSAPPETSLALGSEVPAPANDDPLNELGDAYASWRLLHPCPELETPAAGDATPPEQAASPQAGADTGGCTAVSSHGRAGWGWLGIAAMAGRAQRRRARPDKRG